MADIIPEVGNWVTKSWQSEAGKVLEVDRESGRFKVIFFTEDSDFKPSLESAEWYNMSDIYEIITDPEVIGGLEEDYAKC